MLQGLSETEQGQGAIDYLSNAGLLPEATGFVEEPRLQSLLGATPEPVFQPLLPEPQLQSLLGPGQVTDREKELKQAGTTLNINIGPQ